MGAPLRIGETTVSEQKEVPVLTAEIAYAWCDADEIEQMSPPNEMIDGMEAIAEGRTVCVPVITRERADVAFAAWRQTHWPKCGVATGLMLHSAFHAGLAELAPGLVKS